MVYNRAPTTSATPTSPSTITEYPARHNSRGVADARLDLLIHGWNPLHYFLLPISSQQDDDQVQCEDDDIYSCLDFTDLELQNTISEFDLSVESGESVHQGLWIWKSSLRTALGPIHERALHSQRTKEPMAVWNKPYPYAICPDWGTEAK
ncbi:hypothetical protein C8J56DRAFT_889451 [Mycena floridula]|nr:hypothetical protein C8J56DRAFT_889451 [Mycena floridula]